MDNYKSISELSTNLRDITGAKYGSMRKLADLEALLIVAETLAIQLEAHPERRTNRQLMLIAKTLEMHLVKIRRRAAHIERMNEAKASAMRSEKARLNLVDTLIQSGAISGLIANQRETKQELIARTKIDALESRKAIASATMKEITASGLPINGTLQEREEWAKQRERQAIPGTDLSKQGDEILARMQKLEQQRLKEIDNPAQGSAEDWGKLL